jgi:putative membrane protein
MVLALQQWEATGHDVSLAWYQWLGLVGPWVLLVALVSLVVRALARNGHYRALNELDDADREAVHEALREAERGTIGEIVPVVVERSDAHPGAKWLSALSFLLIGTALLAPHLPWEHPAVFMACQIALGALGWVVARALPDFRRLFVPVARATEVCEEQALQEFFGNGLHETERRTGVLLFVSLLEHRVVVLADKGIAEVVDADTWNETDRAILEGIRAGSLRDGLVAGIRRSGAVLAEHFPWEDGDRNELPDRLIVRSE